MYNEPKYDDDLVTLGYLKNYSSNQQQNNNANNYSRNYSAPPNPPYYINDTLMLDGKIYICIYERLNGNFNWNDWKLEATDDSKAEFVETLISDYELPIPKQLDGKIESFYQNDDPSIEWEDDVERAIHNGDLWRCGRLDYIYKKQNTNPISYKWERYDLPTTLFNTITGHKNIFTTEPVNYEKSDYWFFYEIENPPQNVEVGDLLIASESSDVYQSTHWSRNDVKVLSVSAPEDTYYTKEEVIEIRENIEESTTTKISQSQNNILSTVETTYTTKIETQNLSGEVLQISEEVSTQGTAIAQNSNDISLVAQNFNNSTKETESTINKLKLDLDGFNISLQTMETQITKMNFDFKTDGLSISTETSETNSRLDNEGIKVYNYTKLSAIFNHRGSGIDKLIVTGTAQLGYLRIVKGIKNSKKVTQIFHLDNLIEDLQDLVGDK